MKKLCILLLILLTPLITPHIVASDSIFIWGYEEIDVPFGSDKFVYFEMVKNSIKLKPGYEDPFFKVINDNLDYTTQSTISTSVIRRYKLVHEAFSPKYNIRERRIIYFNVVDVNPPVLTSSKPLVIQIGDQKPDFLQGITYKDDVDPVEKIQVDVHDGGVDYDHVGVYEVIYTLRDSSGNVSKRYKETLTIEDLIKPIITFKEKTFHHVGYPFLIDDFFDIKDNYDPHPKLTYQIEGDLLELGVVRIHVVGMDASGNMSTMMKEIHVVDTRAPVIEVLKPNITLEVGSAPIDLYTLVKVSDNHTVFTKEDLKITHNINYHEVGSYFVFYQIEDASFNQDSKQIKINIRDTIPPVISGENMAVSLNEDIDLYEGLYISDNYSKKDKITIKIFETNYQKNKQGTYYVTYEAVDESGNHTYFTRYISVGGSSFKHIIFYTLIGLFLLSGVGFGIFILIKKHKKLKI